MLKNKKTAIGAGIIGLGIGIATFLAIKKKDRIKELINKKKNAKN